MWAYVRAWVYMRVCAYVRMHLCGRPLKRVRVVCMPLWVDTCVCVCGVYVLVCEHTIMFDLPMSTQRSYDTCIGPFHWSFTIWSHSDPILSKHVFTFITFLQHSFDDTLSLNKYPSISREIHMTMACQMIVKSNF